jgi:hypothetical protein
MSHRSGELGLAAQLTIKAAVNTVVFLIAWIFMPWWAALILAFLGFFAWWGAEQVDWSEIDWGSWWDW